MATPSYSVINTVFELIVSVAISKVFDWSQETIVTCIVGDDNFRYLVGKTLNKENGVPFFDGLTVDGGYGNDEALEKKKAAAKSAESKKLATKSLEPEEPVAKKENGRRMLDGGPILAGGAIDSGAPGKKQLVVKSAEPKQPSPKTPKPTESEKPVAKMEVPNNK